jgi:hypothetical protein
LQALRGAQVLVRFQLRPKVGVSLGLKLLLLFLPLALPPGQLLLPFLARLREHDGRNLVVDLTVPVRIEKAVLSGGRLRFSRRRGLCHCFHL